MKKIDKKANRKSWQTYDGLEIETKVNKLFIVILFFGKSRVDRLYRLISNQQRGWVIETRFYP